uniref:Kinesin motor domain-containing protein n=1 Tax=Haemonchus placei TaxID=6290 RepID=A0A0N4WQU4_HAEPC
LKNMLPSDGLSTPFPVSIFDAKVSVSSFESRIASSILSDEVSSDSSITMPRPKALHFTRLEPLGGRLATGITISPIGSEDMESCSVSGSLRRVVGATEFPRAGSDKVEPCRPRGDFRQPVTPCRLMALRTRNLEKSSMVCSPE